MRHPGVRETGAAPNLSCTFPSWCQQVYPHTLLFSFDTFFGDAFVISFTSIQLSNILVPNLPLSVKMACLGGAIPGRSRTPITRKCAFHSKTLRKSYRGALNLLSAYIPHSNTRNIQTTSDFH